MQFQVPEENIYLIIEFNGSISIINVFILVLKYFRNCYLKIFSVEFDIGMSFFALEVESNFSVEKLTEYARLFRARDRSDILTKVWKPKNVHT